MKSGVGTLILALFILTSSAICLATEGQTQVEVCSSMFAAKNSDEFGGLKNPYENNENEPILIRDKTEEEIKKEKENPQNRPEIERDRETRIVPRWEDELRKTPVKKKKTPDYKN